MLYVFPALAPCDGTSLVATETSGAVYLLRSRVETGHTSVDDAPTNAHHPEDPVPLLLLGTCVSHPLSLSRTARPSAV